MSQGSILKEHRANPKVDDDDCGIVRGRNVLILVGLALIPGYERLRRSR